MSDTNPKWLKSAVSKGLAGLVLLRLPNTPPEELIQQTAKVWLLAITQTKLFNGWNEQDDKWRIEKAFLQLYAECDRFPSPKMLIERLPKRVVLELPEPTLTAEQQQRNAENWRKLKEFLKCTTTAKR